MSHSVLRQVLTPQISKMIETPIFGSDCVVGTIPYAQFCPIPSLLISIFSKNDFKVRTIQFNLTLFHTGSGTYVITREGAQSAPSPEKCLFMQEIILFCAKFIFYIILAFFWGI